MLHIYLLVLFSALLRLSSLEEQNNLPSEGTDYITKYLSFVSLFMFPTCTLIICSKSKSGQHEANSKNWRNCIWNMYFPSPGLLILLSPPGRHNLAWTRKINTILRPRNINREMKVAKQTKQPFKLVQRWLRVQCENMKSQLFSAGCHKYSVGQQKGKI